MTEVINLKQKRKAKARTEKENTAAQNRRKYGQTREEKDLAKLKAKQAERHIESHKLETKE